MTDGMLLIAGDRLTVDTSLITFRYFGGDTYSSKTREIDPIPYCLPKVDVPQHRWQVVVDISSHQGVSERQDRNHQKISLRGCHLVAKLPLCAEVVGELLSAGTGTGGDHDADGFHHFYHNVLPVLRISSKPVSESPIKRGFIAIVCLWQR